MVRNSAWMVAAAAAGLAAGPVGAGSALDAPFAFSPAWCGEAQGAGAAAAVPGPPQLVEGLGYSGIAPDTQDAEARAWFDQGVRFVWGFDEAEGIRAFQQAQKRDPNCAMCFWGEAWARSPTINLNPRTQEFAAAKAASAKAAQLGTKLSERDRTLIAATQARTAGASDFDGQAYVQVLEAAAVRFPTDDAVAVMAADARMQLAEGRRMPEGTLAQKLLETTLRRNPEHTGAIHYYIHLTDWVENQKLAEPHANKLARLAPGSSHLVHMPSHTFYGVGRYKDAMEANVAALAIDEAYERKVRPPGTAYRAGLNRHNTNFAIGSALMIGDATTALKTADYFRNLYANNPGDTGGQFPRASIYFAYGLHGDVKDVLALPEPSAQTPLLGAMRHYARGEALARAGDARGVLAEAAALEKARATAVLPPQAAAWGPPMLEIGQRVLEGRAAMLAGRPRVAEKAYRQAMALQRKAQFSTDPPTWWYPVRRSLAAALIEAGDFRSARNQLLATLQQWPNDPVAYYLLSRAERGLGRKAEAGAYLTRAKANWVGDIESLPLSRA